MNHLLERLRGGLIVSCQAQSDNPVYGPRFMAAFAEAAAIGGAVGIRANGAADVRAIRRAVDLPIIGIQKLRETWPVIITPTVASARGVVKAGAEIVALDATDRARRGGLGPAELIRQVKAELGVLVMADIDTLENGLRAAESGADLVGTTLSGYTEATAHLLEKGPDFALLRALARRLKTPLICEGRIESPEHVARAFDAGAFAVVVGTAITNPTAITARYARAAGRRSD